MKQIINHFDLILYKSWADLRAEARRYYISYLWWIFDPVMEMIVFYIVFGILRRNSIEDFIPFLLIGVTVWKWFDTAVKHGSTSILNSRGLIQNINVPKVIFPVIVLFTDTFKFLIVFTILLAFLVFYGLPVNSAYFALPLVLITEFLLASALAFLCAALTPFFPDFTFFLDNSLRVLFYLSGIFFSGKELSPEHQVWFYLNPMATIVESFRDILMLQQMPGMLPLLYISFFSLITIYLAKNLIHHFDKLYPRISVQ